jgi:hypothetical protein
MDWRPFPGKGFCGERPGLKTSLLMALSTFVEVFPVGLIVSLISGAILRKKDPELSSVN